MNDITKGAFSLVPTTFKEAMDYATIISNSNMIPVSYKGKPADIMIAMQMGMDLGLKPIQALQNIAVINGKPSLYGDGLLAVARAHPDFEYIKETMEDDAAVCEVKRKGEPACVIRFSKQDAVNAKLWGRPGPWQAYPERMLKMRARGFALRDTFADALGGIISAEEAADYPTRSEPKVVTATVSEVKPKEIEAKAVEIHNPTTKPSITIPPAMYTTANIKPNNNYLEL